MIWFDEGGALQVDDEMSSALVAQALRDRARPPSRSCAPPASRPDDDPAFVAAACELVLEALVARKKISRSDAGQYGRAQNEQRRRPNQDMFGGGMSA